MSGQTDSQVVASLMQVAKGHFSAPVPRKTITTFISDYQFEIEYECDQSNFKTATFAVLSFLPVADQ